MLERKRHRLPGWGFLAVLVGMGIAVVGPYTPGLQQILSAQADPIAKAAAKTSPANKPAAVRTDTFAIQGMFCADCARRITAKVRKTTGVKAVSIDYETGKGTITYEAGKVNPAQLIQAIQRAGYKAKRT